MRPCWRCLQVLQCNPKQSVSSPVIVLGRSLKVIKTTLAEACTASTSSCGIPGADTGEAIYKGGTTRGITGRTHGCVDGT
jgi:hypothetical protein